MKEKDSITSYRHESYTNIDDIDIIQKDEFNLSFSNQNYKLEIMITKNNFLLIKCLVDDIDYKKINDFNELFKEYQQLTEFNNINEIYTFLNGLIKTKKLVIEKFNENLLLIFNYEQTTAKGNKKTKKKTPQNLKIILNKVVNDSYSEFNNLFGKVSYEIKNLNKLITNNESNNSNLLKHILFDIRKEKEEISIKNEIIYKINNKINFLMKKDQSKKNNSPDNALGKSSEDNKENKINTNNINSVDNSIFDNPEIKNNIDLYNKIKNLIDRNKELEDVDIKLKEYKERFDDLISEFIEATNINSRNFQEIELLTKELKEIKDKKQKFYKIQSQNNFSLLEFSKEEKEDKRITEVRPNLTEEEKELIKIKVLKSIFHKQDLAKTRDLKRIFDCFLIRTKLIALEETLKQSKINNRIKRKRRMKRIIKRGKDKNINNENKNQ